MYYFYNRIIILFIIIIILLQLFMHINKNNLIRKYLIKARNGIDCRCAMFDEIFSSADPIEFRRSSYSLNCFELRQIQPFVDSWSEPFIIFADRQSFMVRLR